MRAEPLRQRDARRRLALAGLGRRDRRDDDELAVGLARRAGGAVDSFTLARYSPNISSSSGLMPAAAAMSAIGRSCTSWVESSADFI